MPGASCSRLALRKAFSSLLPSRRSNSLRGSPLRQRGARSRGGEGTPARKGSIVGGLGETLNPATNWGTPSLLHASPGIPPPLPQTPHPLSNTGRAGAAPSAPVHLPPGRGALHRGRRAACTPAKPLCEELSPEIRRRPRARPRSRVPRTWERGRDAARRPGLPAPLRSRAPRAQDSRIRAASRSPLSAAAAAAAASAPVTA